MNKVEDFLKALPEAPGVYIMYDEKGNVIYIGKSRNLKSRVSSYFHDQKHLSTRIRRMVNNIKKIEYIVVNNESESLILEANLIKRYKPRYNILMKDSKFYPFVMISKDEYPFINATREYEPEKYEYFGPYTDSRIPYDLVDVIQRVFKIRTCRKLPKKVCLNYYINRCSAPCENKISKDEYLKNCELAREVLRGNVQKVIEQLSEEMRKEAKNLNFEKASFYRDSIKLLESLEEQKQNVFLPGSNLNADVIGIFESEELASFFVLHIVNGKVSGKTAITVSKNDEEDYIEKFLSDIYLVSERLGTIKTFDVQLITTSSTKERITKFFEKLSTNVLVREPNDEVELRILETAIKNAEIAFNNHFSKFDMYSKEGQELAKILKIGDYVSIIDGFDVANYSDEMAVGSAVRLIDGIPSKKDYRIFKMKWTTGQNDFGMIEETVSRHYRRILESKGQLPDLVLIDGGKGQLNAAINALRKLNLNLPIVSLAKEKEKIILPDGNELILPKNSYALRLLQRVRDEAHRFGNSFIRRMKLKILF